MAPINTDQKNKIMMGKAHVNFERLKQNPNLYPDELVNTRSSFGTFDKHLHLASNRLA